MTRTIDLLWIALGVNAEELTALKGRGVIYLGLGLMALASSVLVAGIASNLAGMVA